MATPPTQSGWLIQRPGGPHGNFELMNSASGTFHDRSQFATSIPHYWYDQADWVAATAPWHLSENVRRPESPRSFAGASLILSSYGNLECVALQPSGPMVHFALLGVLGWHRIAFVAPGGVLGFPPAFIQSRFGRPDRGNFEVVVPSVGGGLMHLFRDNANDEPTWQDAASPASPQMGPWEGVSLLHSSFGNLEIVGVMGGRLTFLWQNGPGGPWSDPVVIDRDLEVRGRPGFIQSPYGGVGNFEVAVALRDGRFAHFWRNNDDPNHPWSRPVIFGDLDEGPMDDVSIIHTSFGQLDVVARAAGSSTVVHFRAPRAAPWTRATVGPVLSVT